MSDRYRLVRPLASGGMAELFLGVAHGAEGFERKVAIKRMLPNLAREPTIAQMFVAEARLAMHLQHQNITSVYDVGQGPGGLFLVMELVNGWDLGILLRHAQQRGQRFPPHLVALIATQVLAGLAHAYRRLSDGRQVMSAHRDVSPSNILVSREGEVKVTDFGIARVEGLSMGTQPGTFKGKFPYAAPETLRGQPATAASDQFALGVVLYELLAGHHPFGDDANNHSAFIYAITSVEPPPLQGVPPLLQAVVQRALAKEPAQRYPRAEDMAEALALYLARAGKPASSQSLAAFIASLQPPHTLVEHSEALAQQDETEPNSRTRLRQSLPPLALEQGSSSAWAGAGSFELELENGEQPLPGGAQLSTSGRLVDSGATGPALALAEQQAAAEPVRSAGSPGRAAEEPLELAERPPRPQQEVAAYYRQWEAPTGERPRRVPWLALTAVVLLAGAGAALLLLPSLQPWRRTLEARARQLMGPAASLTITSEPSGAAVTAGGLELGTTPLSMDNTFPPGPVEVELTLKGYKPWRGTFQGSEPASLNAALKPR